MAPVSLSDTFRPLTTLTAPPKSLSASSVMSWAEPAVRVAVPATDRFPLSVTEPLAVTARLPLTVEAPRSMAPVSLSVRLFTLKTLTAPPKSLALSSVMSLPEPASSAVVPETSSAPLSVMAPVAATARLPLIVEAPRSMASEVPSTTSRPLSTTTLFSVLKPMPSEMSLVDPAESVSRPLTARLPTWVIGPLANTVSASPTETYCSTMPPAVALSVMSSYPSVSPFRVMFEPVRLRSTFALTLVPTVRSPPAVTVTLPPVLVTVWSTSESASVTVMLEPAFAVRLAAARLRPIETGAVAVTASAVIRPEPEMLPEVALSVTSLPAAVVLPFTTRAPDVMSTSPAVLVTALRTSVPSSATVMVPVAAAARLAARRARSIEPVAVALTPLAAMVPGPEMLPPVTLSVAL